MLEEGIKHDEDKVRMDLLSPLFLLNTADVLTYGAKKYEAHNWLKGINYSRVFAAMQRHLWAWWNGEENDPETGLSHLSHASCCLMFLLHYQASERFPEFDDRAMKEGDEDSTDSADS